MRRSSAALMLALPVAVSVGCTRPDLDLSRIRTGMTKKEVIERAGSPTRTTVTNDTEVWEYEAYERYGAIKVNARSRFVRFVRGQVDAFGSPEDLKAGRAALVAPAGPAKEAAAAPQPAPPAFDLRTELEKLEKLKKDGLISEPEFQELRKKVLDKARAQ